jgi:hypothetical protein
LDETLDLAWRVLSVLPSRELTMVSKAQLDAHYVERTSSDGRENQPQPKEGEEQSAAAPEEVSEPKQPAASKQRVGQEKATAAETTAAEKGKVKA